MLAFFGCISSHFRRIIFQIFPGEQAPGPPYLAHACAFALAPPLENPLRRPWLWLTLIHSSSVLSNLHGNEYFVDTRTIAPQANAIRYALLPFMPSSLALFSICTMLLGDSFFLTAFGSSFSMGPFCFTSDIARN